MADVRRLLENNKRWSESIRAKSPEFFPTLSAQQAPKYLWIGCADSRVPANEIVGMQPGELFVHRNVANVVVHTDFNCLSVLQYAVEVLKVEHIIVCGHYGCGGVKAALEPRQLGLIDNWLRHVKDVWEKHKDEVLSCGDSAAQLNRLCELNVREQVFNVCHTTIVQSAWLSGQPLTVRGWIYGIHDGLLHELDVRVSSQSELSEVYRVDL